MPIKSNTNLRELLENRANERGDKIFLFAAGDGRSWRYTDFDKAVNRAANLLKKNAVGKGDVVSLLLPNSPEYVIAYFACWKIGALAGPINSLLKREEISYALDHSEAKLLLVNSEFLPKIKSSESPLSAGDSGKLKIIIFDDEAKATENCGDNLTEIEIEKDDDAIIIYTSGTTGKPKGCLLTHGNLLANARQITEWMNFTTSDRLLTIMPLFHMNAVSVTTLTALYAGGSTVVAPKFSASKFWQIVEDYQITSFGSVATMLSMLLQNADSKFQIPDSRTKTLRFAMCGSAPVPAEILKQFEETFGCLVIEGYGLSESTCRSTFNPPNAARRAGSCGKPIGNEMKIFDENDREVPNGALGEIVLRGANIFKGYFKNAAATTRAFANGWFHTGDIGYRDADNFFYIADRKSDMIIRGGENIYPREIDDVLYAHPAVEAAAVIGIPDRLYGEAVAAFVVLKTGENVSEETLTAFCQSRLADFKCPQKIYFVEEIPKGATGKLLKRELARRHLEKENL